MPARTSEQSRNSERGVAPVDVIGILRLGLRLRLALQFRLLWAILLWFLLCWFLLIWFLLSYLIPSLLLLRGSERRGELLLLGVL